MAHTFMCCGCSRQYVAKAINRNRYCSRECFAASRKQRVDARMRERLASLTRACRQCGVTFTAVKANGTICSEACRVIRGRRLALLSDQRKDARDRSSRNCRECGTIFSPAYGNKRRTFCSSECSDKRNNRVGKAQRRARCKGITRSAVDPLAIFERDRWRCHLCGIGTPARLRGTCHRRAPELDHILPLAIGGAHTPENLACSCRTCNQFKGSKPLGQMRLALQLAG